MAIKGRFPAIRPSLDLNFAKTKRLDPRITFTRASIGTYVGRDGLIKTAGVNEARFDHNPTTGESLGLLVEDARTNLVRNNTMVGAVAGSPGTPPTNGWVITNNATYASSIIGTGVENGINYIDIQYVIAAGAAASGGIIYPDTPAATASTAYTGSSYLKLVSGTSPQARFVWQDNVSTYNRTLFDLTSTLTRYTDTLTTAVGAGLARLAFGFAASPSGATFVIRIGLPQVELGAFATSVIPTTSATATRAADVASITGSNFSSWYNQTEGAVFAEGLTFGGSSTNCLVSIDDNTTSNRIQLRRTIAGPASSLRMVSSGGSIDANLTTGTALGLNKIAAGVAASNQNLASNGILATGITSITPMPVVTQAVIGNGAASTHLNGTIRRLTYWPQRLSNATLQALTS